MNRFHDMSFNTTTIDHSPITPVSSISNCAICTGWEEHKNFWKRLALASIILLTFIIILTILGNTLVLVATWIERSLHQPNKYFIACLAVADLLVGLFVAPARLNNYMVWYKYYDNALEVIPELNIHFCRFLVWMDTVSFGASISTLTFISFDRYLKITMPLQYKSRMTTSRSLRVIFIIWLVSSCFATYAATPGSGSRGILRGARLCGIRGSYVNSNIFYTILSIIWFIIPTIIILIMYTLIFVVAHKRRKMLQNGELRETNNDKNQRATFLKDLKVITMLLVVIGVFMICWGPLVIYLFLVTFNPNFHNNLSDKSFLTLHTIVFNLPLLNSACNPKIYACLDQTYNQAFKHLFQRMMCRPSSTLPSLQLRPIRTREQNA